MGATDQENARLVDSICQKLVETCSAEPMTCLARDDGIEDVIVNQTSCALLMPDHCAAEKSCIEYRFTEGKAVVEFLKALEDSGHGKGITLRHKVLKNSIFDDSNDTGRLIYAPIGDDVRLGQGRGIPQAPRYHGWFHGEHGVSRRKEVEIEGPNFEFNDKFTYKLQQSPVKVPLGSLFATATPGRMTGFESLKPMSGDELKNDSRQRSPVGVSDILSVDNEAIHLQTNKFWSGEESEIARDALSCLYGVNAAVQKLTGRLLVPEALPRIALVNILAPILRASNCRLDLHMYISKLGDNVSHPGAGDIIEHAFACSLQTFLLQIDELLMDIEKNQSKNWVQNIGMVGRDQVQPLDEYVKLIETQSTSCAPAVKGMEFHGTGLSLLQLARDTAHIRSRLIFVHGIIFTEEDMEVEEACANVPKGVALLDFLYEKGGALEGGNGRLVRQMIKECLIPYVMTISNWAFRVAPMGSEDYLTEPLSQEYLLDLPRDKLNRKDIPKIARNVRGPCDGPSFFSSGFRKELLIAGAQLRLLQSSGIPGASNLVDSFTCLKMSEFELDSRRKDWFSFKKEQSQRKTDAGTADKGPPRVFQSALGEVSEKNARLAQAYQGAVDLWLQDLKEYKQGKDNREMNAMKGRDSEVDAKFDIIDSLLKHEDDSLPFQWMIHFYIEDPIKIAASALSRACLNLFIDYLDISKTFKFLRDLFLGFCGDFQMEFTKQVDRKILSLKPMTKYGMTRLLQQSLAVR